MHHNLAKLAPYDKQTSSWRAIIETPRGSHHKFDYDPEHGCFQLKKTLPEGMTFPLDFGFIPGTRADDGDPLDVMVLLDFPAQMSAMVRVRLIGGIEAEQKERGGKWKRNDRFIAVAAHSQTLADMRSLSDMRPKQLDELIEFFTQYNKLEGRKFRSIGKCTPDHAQKLIRAGLRKEKK